MDVLSRIFLFAYFMIAGVIGNPLVIRNLYPTNPRYPVPLTTGPVTARPSSSIGSIYHRPNLNQSKNHTSHGSDTDITIIETIVRTVTMTDSGCTINARKANLIFWDTTTYNTTLVIHGVGTDAVSDTFSVDLNTLPSFSAATTKTISFDPRTSHTATNVITGATYTSTNTYSFLSFPPGQTQPVSETRTQVVTEDYPDRTVTITNMVFLSLTAEGATDVLRPDIVSKGVTSVYTIHSPTPYVYYSVFEVERQIGGSTGSALSISTSTFTVPAPFLSPLDFNGTPGFSGLRNDTIPLSPGVLDTLTDYKGDLSDCVVGTAEGDVTVYIVYYVTVFAVSPAHVEISVSDLGGDLPIPSPTQAPAQVPKLPNFASPTPKKADQPPKSSVKPLPKPPLKPVLQPQAPKESPPATSQAPNQKKPPAKEKPGPANAPSNTSLGPKNGPTPQDHNSASGNQATAEPLFIAPVTTPIIFNPSQNSGIGKPTENIATPSGTPINAPIGRPTLFALPPALTTLKVGNVRVTISSNNIIVNSQTIRPILGSPPTTAVVDGHSIVINPSQLIGGGTTVALPAIPSIHPIITVGASAITANSQKEFLISSQTLSPGGPILTVGGTILSLAPSASAIVIGSKTINLANPSAPLPLPPSVTFGSSVVTANSAGEFIISGQTLEPGGTALSISGTILSLAPSASEIVIGSNTINLAKPSPILPLPSITFGSSIIAANSASEFVISGQTLVPGGTALTISGTTLSLAPSASQIVIGGTTINLAKPSPSLPSITFGSSILTANSHTEFVIGTQTVSPGSPAITISGTPLSLAPSGSIIVINNTPFPLEPKSSFSLPVIITLPSSEFLIGSQTLIPGHPAITVSGTPVSLAPGASDVVVGTSTEPLASFILQGFGASTQTSTPYPSVSENIATFEGAATAAVKTLVGRSVWAWIGGFWVLGYGLLEIM